jgi:hypothetical protein
MPSPVVLVPGTSELNHPGGHWIDPDSTFSRMLKVEGLTVLEPCRWDTDLDGLWGPNVAWAVGGGVLADHLQALGLKFGGASIISHSHGGQVVAEAAAHGVRFDRVVTLAMPVRRDMVFEYRMLRANARSWSAVYSLESGGIPWQALGEVKLTDPRTWPNIFNPVRGDTKPYPLIFDPTAPTHQSLMEPARWLERGWARLLYGEHAQFDPDARA